MKRYLRKKNSRGRAAWAWLRLHSTVSAWECFGIWQNALFSLQISCDLIQSSFSFDLPSCLSFAFNTLRTNASHRCLATPPRPRRALKRTRRRRLAAPWAATRIPLHSPRPPPLPFPPRGTAATPLCSDRPDLLRGYVP
jgi:hypothetical protein